MTRATVSRLGMGRGYCETGILNSGAEETLHWQHQEFGSAVELNATLTDFFSRLRDLPDAEHTADVTAPALLSAD